MNTDGNTKVIISAIVLIVVVVAGWFIVVAHNKEASMNATSSTSTTTASSATSSSQTSGGNSANIPSSNSVAVADQGASMSVEVHSVSLTQEGWVAIRDNSGRTLGAALFPAGTQNNVSVPLLRQTTPGQRYQAMLYFDDGNKTFNLHTETLVENSDGSVAGTMFTAQ